MLFFWKQIFKIVDLLTVSLKLLNNFIFSLKFKTIFRKIKKIYDNNAKKKIIK